MDGASTTSSTVARAYIDFVNPSSQVNGGIWSLFVGTTAFLALRIWCKITRRHGLWWDDYILIASWVSTRLLRSVPFGSGLACLVRVLGPVS